ncbi:MAG: nuclear transport factor 2 family protein [Acidimicrobiales bacterium]
MTLSTADRFEIHELVARYNKAIDTGDATGWADTFAEDGEFVGLVGTFKGRDQLEGFVREYVTNPEFAEWAASQHWTTNLVIDGDGERAELFAHVMMVHPEADGGRIVLVGWYEDRLARIDGRWRFTQRIVRSSAPPV